MTPDEIIEAYNVLAQNVQDNTAQEAARIGNAQRSLGTLAERVASPSGQTSGLANYTYDRTMRPAVDSTAKALVTQGLAQGLQTNLSDALRAAKSRYEDARNRAASSGGGGGGGGTTTGGGSDPYTETTDSQYSPTFNYEKAVRDSARNLGLYGDVSFKEDVQARIKDAYDQGLIDESTWIRLYTFADNELPSLYDEPYASALGTGSNTGGGGGW